MKVGITMGMSFLYDFILKDNNLSEVHKISINCRKFMNKINTKRQDDYDLKYKDSKLINKLIDRLNDK